MYFDFGTENDNFPFRARKLRWFYVERRSKAKQSTFNPTQRTEWFDHQ